ncbi:MAG: histidinol-phosphate aminotransferase family protein [Kordiimonadaceae bacterium]|jgi:histidinol-phosphate aminotransferase|nr:histidinol-phosphate aminotransferase family protein [Kordiimonadaceae bacterium]MBT6037380.1 histidinol-phosphate aminotransferase family protein [Kordiimonadaceae bacterium]
MANDVSRRDWLKGGSAIAMAMLLGEGANAQNMAVPGFVPTPENPIRLGTNENPYGMSRVARNAIIDMFDTAHLYGRGKYMELIDVLAEMEGAKRENITFSGGSGEILKTLGLITAVEGGSVLTADPTYHDLTRYAGRRGVNIIQVPVDDNMTIDLDAMRAAYTDDVSIIYLVNPNNPLPTIMEKNKLKEFCLEMSQKCLVFIDEAYHEYVQNPDYETMVPLAVANENILVARTASKIHGFAGVRLGIAYGSPTWIGKLREFMTGGTNQLAVAGAAASYKDTETQDFCRRKNQESLAIVYELFDKHNVNYVKSNANFVFFETGQEATEVRQLFRDNGVLVGRPFAPFTTWCRVSMGKPEDMRYFAEVYEKLFT